MRGAVVPETRWTSTRDENRAYQSTVATKRKGWNTVKRAARAANQSGTRVGVGSNVSRRGGTQRTFGDILRCGQVGDGFAGGRFKRVVLLCRHESAPALRGGC